MGKLLVTLLGRNRNCLRKANSTERCVAGAFGKISPEAVVFPPQEGHTLNVNQAAVGTSDSSIRMPAKRLPSQGVPGCCSRGKWRRFHFRCKRNWPVCRLSTATCNPISYHHQVSIGY